MPGTSRASSTSPRKTSATRPTRAPARAPTSSSCSGPRSRMPSATRRLRIGVSARIQYGDREAPRRAQEEHYYVEQSFARWVQSGGALAFLIPDALADLGDARRLRARARRPRAARRHRHLTVRLRRGAAAARVGGRPASRSLRARPARALHGCGQAGARHLPRPAADQRRARRHALPGHRAPAAGSAASPGSRRSTTRTSTTSRSSPARAWPSSTPACAPAKVNTIHHQAVKRLGRDLVGRSALERRRRDRGDPLHGPRLRRSACSGTRSSSIRPTTTLLDGRAHPFGVPRMLRITNPADDSLIRELAEDDAASIAAKYRAARAAQAGWAARTHDRSHRSAARLQGARRKAPRRARAHAHARDGQALAPVVQ